MSYDMLILAFLMLIFCFFMQILTIKVMFSLFNSVRPEGTEEVKPFIFTKKRPKKVSKEDVEEQRRYETIMRNVDAYDGTGIGQEEVK